MASIKGALSISPTVPPNYQFHFKASHHISSYFHDANIWFFPAIIDWHSTHSLHPVLNCGGYMRHYLDRFTQVIPSTLALDQLLLLLILTPLSQSLVDRFCLSLCYYLASGSHPKIVHNFPNPNPLLLHHPIQKLLLS